MRTTFCVLVAIALLVGLTGCAVPGDRQYKQLRFGMTHAEAARVLGSGGTVWLPERSVIWTVNDGSGLRVIFAADKKRVHRVTDITYLAPPSKGGEEYMNPPAYLLAVAKPINPSFAKVTAGQTYPEVVGLLGRKGEEAEDPAKYYVWKARNNTRIILEFVNDKLVGTEHTPPVDQQ